MLTQFKKVVTKIKMKMKNINEKLDLELSHHDIYRKREIGTVTPMRTKQDPLLQKFIRYAEKNKLFTDKRLKNSMNLVLNVWAEDRMIMHLVKISRKHILIN